MSVSTWRFRERGCEWMRKAYYTINEVLQSPWAAFKPTTQKPASTDRVLRSTKLEDSIYADLRGADKALDDVERTAGEKLRSFPALSRDVYQSFYSLMPRRREDAELSVAARKFNAHILEHITQSEDYPTLKTVCEGRELPAYEAASEFITRTAGELDDLLGNIGGNEGSLNTLERLEQSAEAASMDLATLLEQMRRSVERNETLEKAVIDAANTAECKRRQVEAVDRLIDAGLLRSKAAVGEIVAHAVSAAAERAGETEQIIAAWSDDPACMEKSEVNMQLLALVRESAALREISKYLGRFREIIAQGRRNGYAYGRGEKYSLELGNDLSRALSSELSMLSSPKTLPLFLQKYQRRQIKQYQRREPVYKGSGDIICCLDESSSTAGEDAAWGKAVALTLLEIAGSCGRSFALVHFSGQDNFRTDVFRPSTCTAADRMAAAECFLGGGTNFESPMRETLRLMEQEGFENADVVFITDGVCVLPDTFREELAKEQAARRFTVTGVLLDQGSPGMDFSLRAFCQNIYRTSELVGDEIVRRLVNQKT